MIGRYLHQCEENGVVAGGEEEGDEGGGGSGGGGVRWDEVVTWYLEERLSEIETEEQLDLEKEIVNKVIRKLLTESGTLIYLGIPSADTPEEETIIALHPGIDPRSL
mmetsp:Transcript_6278/g.10573  ORF Transcript_6278/g.10573 Transcript_6278/m.10573 type:complete len:107 (-) Transcript_6278:179-499(-)